MQHVCRTSLGTSRGLTHSGSKSKRSIDLDAALVFSLVGYFYWMDFPQLRGWCCNTPTSRLSLLSLACLFFPVIQLPYWKTTGGYWIFPGGYPTSAMVPSGYVANGTGTLSFAWIAIVSLSILIDGLGCLRWRSPQTLNEIHTLYILIHSSCVLSTCFRKMTQAVL